MVQFIFANNADTTLAGPVATNSTSINLAAGTGILFPQPVAGQQFALTLISQSDESKFEIVYCTARSGDQCTIIRGQEGTTSNTFIAGDLTRNLLTAGTTAAFIQTSQLQQQLPNYAIDTGSASNVVITLNPTPASFASIVGAPIRVLVAATNTGNTTLTINGLGTAGVFAQSAVVGSLAAGSIVGGQIYESIATATIGFEVTTARALLSTANTFALTQTEANNKFWSGNNTSGVPQSLIGMDTANQTTMFAGNPASPTAWRVANQSGTNSLLTINGTTGQLNALGGLTGGVGSAGRNNAFWATILNDFQSGTAGNGWWFTIPTFGLTPTNAVIIQGGVIATPADGSGHAYNLPKPFPNTFLGIVISFGASTPPAQGAIGAQPLNQVGFSATNTSTQGGTNGCEYIAIGY